MTPAQAADASRRFPHNPTMLAFSEAMKAGFDEDMARRIAFSPNVDSIAAANAAVAEAVEIVEIFKHARSLAEKFDLDGVARDFIRHRIPLQQVGSEILDMMVSFDVHIDTSPPPCNLRNFTGMDAMAQEVWASRKAEVAR